MPLYKRCPCSGCGKPAMCVSHDTFKFYCNRCLPHYVRQNFYWQQPQTETSQTETKPTSLEAPAVTQSTKSKQAKK